MSFIVPDSSNIRQYEVGVLLNEVREISEHIEKLKAKQCSKNIALIPEINRVLDGIELVKKVEVTTVEFLKTHKTKISFLIPLNVLHSSERFNSHKKNFTKSNINVWYAVPRNERDWYETQIKGYPENISYESLRELLTPYLDKKFSFVDTGLINNILSYTKPDLEIRLEAFKAIVDSIIFSNSKEKAILIVRTGRDVNQNTGSLLSPNDRGLGKEYEMQLVFTIYEVVGGDWSASKLWIPNIKLPFPNKLYYAVVE